MLEPGRLLGAQIDGEQAELVTRIDDSRCPGLLVLHPKKRKQLCELVDIDQRPAACLLLL
jgi:hypothetical protein